jgi:hypothetical protein
MRTKKGGAPTQSSRDSEQSTELAMVTAGKYTSIILCMVIGSVIATIAIQLLGEPSGFMMALSTVVDLMIGTVALVANPVLPPHSIESMAKELLERAHPAAYASLAGTATLDLFGLHLSAPIPLLALAFSSMALLAFAVARIRASAEEPAPPASLRGDAMGPSNTGGDIVKKSGSRHTSRRLTRVLGGAVVVGLMLVVARWSPLGQALMRRRTRIQRRP